MEHVALFKKKEGFTKRFLVELGWSILEQMRAIPPIDECPSPHHILSMNIIFWNCRGALNTSFYQSVDNIICAYSPLTLVITETRMGGT